MKRMMLLLLLLPGAACATAPSSHPDVEATIRGLADEFDAAARARNIDRVAAFYAEDAVLMPPNAPVMTGAGIRQFWGGLLAAPNVDIDLIPDQVQSCGDLAVERGHYEVTTPFRDSGKYIVVWRHRGGRWMIVNDIFNSNVAAPPSGG